MTHGSASDDVVRRLLAGAVADAAGRLAEPDAAAFVLRAQRWLPDVLRPLEALYGDRVDVAELVRDLLDDAVGLVAERSDELRALDRQRESDPDWFQESRMVGYVCYVDRFAGTLTAMRSHLDYLAELGTTYLHLMPVLAPREGESDGGYAVADYDAVDPRIGVIGDLTALASDLHRRGIALCVDLVLNHTAREHPWAQRALTGDPRFRDFYLVYPDRLMPDAFEATLPEIFPGLAPGSFTHVEGLGWVWTTFREFQWDLNYANPDVFRAMLRTMLTLANRGADILRLDAAPFLWKRLGTDCQDQPETHLLLQAFRAMLSVAAPGVLLKAEAMVAPDILTRYLGDHGEYCRECDLAYDNQLMVMLWSMLATGTSDLARQALTRRPAAPRSTSWVTYVRGHDDIGWAVADADAAAVGLDGPAHRRFLSEFYDGTVPGSFAEGDVFQASPTGASPISGTTASLCGVGIALEAQDEVALDLALSRLEALYSVVFSFGGIPLVYMGDELALRNDPAWADEPGHGHDNRWVHRPRMDWAAAERRNQEGTAESRVFATMKVLAAARGELSALRSDASSTVLDLGVPGLLAYVRGAEDGSGLLALVDIGGNGQVVGFDILRSAGFDVPAIAVVGRHTASVADDAVHLRPYGFAWLPLPRD
ncbi:MAG TPA: alpha-amylase family protein [Actinomycetes bacterium]|nr:alpha-amylase family protein [Actinomycetes bacterium]